MEEVASTENGLRHMRVGIVRALSFRPSTSKMENFAVHLQGGEHNDLHVFEESRVGKSPFFEELNWAAVEELCRQLSGLHLDLDRADAFLDAVILDAAQSLRQQGKEELAELLRNAASHKSNIWNISALRYIWGISGNRRDKAGEEALQDVLAVFASALKKLKIAVKGQGDTKAELEHFYNERIGLVNQACCFPQPPLPSYNGKQANIYQDAAFLKNHPKDATKGHLLEREALAFGLSILRFPNGNFIATDRNGKRLNFKWSRSPVSSGLSLALCNHKEATRARLRRCGLPVAKGRVFAGRDRDRLRLYASQIGYPVVCKPVAGVRGIGVVANIANEQQLQEALELFAKNPLGLDDLIIEQHVSGTDYRIVVVGQRVISVVCRTAASVVGTGVHTVADLLLHKNRIRLCNPHLRRRLIQFDEAAKYQLERAELTLASVPKPGQWVQLANSNNISRGGDSIEILDEVHPSIVDAAIAAVEAIPGLGFCGLDMMLKDHRKAISEQPAAIIELNAHGAIGTGQYPMWGTPRNVARQFLVYCAEKQDVELNPTPAESLSLSLRIRGNVTGVGYRRWFRRKVLEFGLTGSIESVKPGLMMGVIKGDTAPVAALVNAAVRGPRGAIPYWVAAEPCADKKSGGAITG